MKLTLKATESRRLVSADKNIFCDNYLGTIGERNATELVFLLPASLQGYAMSLVIVTAQGSFLYDLTDDTFTLPSEVLTDSTLDLQLVLKDGDEVIWKSIPTTFYLNPTLDDTGENIVDKAKAEQRETDRAELGGALKDLTGEDVGGEDWGGLIDKTKALPIKTEQDVIDLTDYSALTYAFERSTTAPSLLTGNYNLGQDEDGFDVYIKLPYLYTPNAVYSETTPIGSKVIECGFDLSASANTFNHYNEKSMLRQGADNLRKLVLTSVEVVPYGNARYYGRALLEELTLWEGSNNPDTYDNNYWNQHFRGCQKLQAILGTPLDMSRGTAYNWMFTQCYALRYVRFKPGTICHDLNLGDCSQLMNRYRAQGVVDSSTLLSIVNGVREYTGAQDKITITFSTFVKDYLTSWRCQKDPETGLYVEAEQGYTLATILTNEKGVIIA